MRHKSTYLALLGYGVDRELAEEITQSRFTVGALKKLSVEKLVELGLRQEAIVNIRDGIRKPIPQETLIKVLYRSQFTCCICQDRSRSVIVHHINKYSETQDNSEDNLVVLCLEHHNEAHSKRDLVQNLTPGIIRGFRDKWYKECIDRNSTNFIKASTANFAVWDYINTARLYEISDQLEIDRTRLPYYDLLLRYGIIDKIGRLTIVEEWSVRLKPQHYLYDFDQGISGRLLEYHRGLLKAALEKLEIIDITNQWSRMQIRALVRSGTIISCQGAFYFRSSPETGNQHEPKIGYRKCDNIRLAFHIDSWEAVSMSARTEHLAGHSVITCICLVRSLLGQGKTMEIKTTCLAIGTAFPQWKEYTPIRFEYEEMPNDPDEDEFDEVESYDLSNTDKE